MPAPVYRRRDPQNSPYYQYVEDHFELQQRAHSPQLAAGLASESKDWQNSLQSKIPCSLLQGLQIMYRLDQYIRTSRARAGLLSCLRNSMVLGEKNICTHLNSFRAASSGGFNYSLTFITMASFRPDLRTFFNRFKALL